MARARVGFDISYMNVPVEKETLQELERVILEDESLEELIGNALDCYIKSKGIESSLAQYPVDKVFSMLEAIETKLSAAPALVANMAEVVTMPQPQLKEVPSAKETKVKTVPKLPKAGASKLLKNMSNLRGG